MQPYLSVIIPSYNEMKNVERGVMDSVVEYLGKQTYAWELILSDDGSTDGTLEYLRTFVAEHHKKYGKSIILQENIHAGKGPTVQAGMLLATGEWRLFTDFDQSTPISEVEELLKFTPQYKVVIGSREIAGAKRNKEPLLRHLRGKTFNIFTQLRAIPGVLDTQCGFKLFSADATERIFSKLFVYGRQTFRKDAFTGAFDVEALFIALKLKYKIKEVPIFWQHNESDRVSALKDSSRMLRDIVYVRLADFQGKYT
ncbi:glycosyltransferase family 2 protein [soil metagenome]